MIHHDNRDYDVAVGETAKRFQAQLEETIEKSRASAANVFEKVRSETPVDAIADSRALEFTVDGTEGSNAVLIGLRNHQAKNFFRNPLHKNGLDQVAERAGVPGTYVNRLLERPYGRELIVQNLSRIYQEEENKKLLIRSVNGQTRGVLSNAFKRMDSGPIIEAFAEACESIGAVPIEGVGGDLRWAIKAILPMVFQPTKKQGSEELISFGVQLSNSDFGKGTLHVNAFMTRVVCTNYATLQQVLRQTHLGKRLSDDIDFSEETRQADTKTMVLMVRDTIKSVLEPAKVHELVGQIGRSLEERINPKDVWAELPKMGLLKGEVDKVRELFADGDVEMLPPGNTMARMSNAVSWFAKTAATAERRLELEEVAGELLIPKQKAAA